MSRYASDGVERKHLGSLKSSASAGKLRFAFFCKYTGSLSASLVHPRTHSQQLILNAISFLVYCLDVSMERKRSTGENQGSLFDRMASSLHEGSHELCCPVRTCVRLKCCWYCASPVDLITICTWPWFHPCTDFRSFSLIKPRSWLLMLHSPNESYPCFSLFISRSIFLLHVLQIMSHYSELHDHSTPSIRLRTCSVSGSHSFFVYFIFQTVFRLFVFTYSG